MVEEQLRGRGIRDARVLRAMGEIPRHLFVPPELADKAYEDHPLSIGAEQTISQPYIVALMTQQLGLKPTSKVLEIGTGSGYQAAVLSKLAKEVYSVERIPELGSQAARRLRSLGVSNVCLRVGDGSQGWPEEAPFDDIIVTACAEKLPELLAAQLADGGRMVIPLGEALHQTLTRIERRGNQLEARPICGCVFVPLR
jgi:protein-L-isoaspartate(D-aspartate) O-methyltransferase